jgi:TolA-binding protein
MRRDLDGMRGEMQSMQRKNAELEKRVEELALRLDLVAARLAHRTAAPERAQAAEPAVPPDLAVVKVEPPRDQPRADPHRRGRAIRAAPPLPTQTPVAEPDPEGLAALGAGRGDPAAEAQAELDAAHRLSGLACARALESFAAHYPRHPRADNALLEAAQARAASGDDDAACGLYARCVDEYPAGDALPDALERLAECHSRRGEERRARALFERVAADYPDTSAAQLAKEHLAAMPPASPARQGAVP